MIFFEEHFYTFLLILIRVSALIVALPYIGGPLVPRPFKIGIVVWMSFLLFPVVEPNTIPGPITWLSLVPGLIGEIFIGLAIGLTARLFFTAVDLAGQIIGMQMGFGLVNMVDPTTRSQTPIIGRFHGLIASLLFFSLNVHHDFIKAIIASFQMIPLYGFQISALSVQGMIHLAGKMFVLAVKIAAPIMVILVLTNIAFGIMVRATPQLNVFVVTFPLTIGIGLLLLGVSLPWFALLMRRGLLGLKADTLGMLSAMG